MIDFEKIEENLWALDSGLEAIKGFYLLLSDVADVLKALSDDGGYDGEAASRVRIAAALIERIAGDDINEEAFRMMSRVQTLKAEFQRLKSAENEALPSNPKSKGRVQ